MRTLLLIIILLATLSGCVVVDRTAVEQAQAQAQAAQAQADAQARTAEAQAQADAARAQADAQRYTAEAQARADVEKAELEAWQGALKTVEEATARNQGILYLLIFAIVGLAGMAIYWFGRSNAIMAQNTARQPQLLPTPHTIALLAQQHGLHAHHDGQRWLLIDDTGVVRQRQKLLTTQGDQ